MHVRLGLAALLAAAIVALAPSPASAATSLGALWHLDEAGGLVAVDSSGNDNDGALNGNPTRIAGRFAGALHFNGDNNVTIPRSPTFEGERVTMEAWVRESSTSGLFKHVMSVGANACDVASYGLYTGATGGLAFYVSDGTSQQIALSPVAAPDTVWDGSWHHVAGTYDGSAVRLYVDGTEVGSGSAAAFPIGYGLPTNADGLLGAFGNPGCLLNYIGDLDAPRIWRRALSRDEIAASAAMGSATTTLLDERIDANQAIVHSDGFRSGNGVNISLESATGTERISVGADRRPAAPDVAGDLQPRAARAAELVLRHRALQRRADGAPGCAPGAHRGVTLRVTVRAGGRSTSASRRSRDQG